ncbi:hypothetical protein NDU88_008061 [Pleurodeles waltl]|uniref:Uncharacterized protein n=1 Tax=Pleurodeles waltl TaxID=8319 RepID=A0AAV7NV37_PLEWA|nr:hypothetical protein NDU88_008061 [Pleurodeles waltl]
MQDATTQALLSAVQLLSILDAPSASVPPTTLWAPTDSLKNTLVELKCQISAITAARITGTAATGTASSGAIPSPGVQFPTPNNLDKGKLASHVPPAVKEKIWKGEFVDIFSLIGLREER